MDVRLPDGTIIQNVPEGTTKAQLVQKLKSNGMNVPAEWGAEPKSIGAQVAQGVGNVLAGAVRGAGSIGATLLYPWDKAQDIYYGDRGKNLSSLVTGKERPSRNQERRAEIDNGLRTMGAEPESLLYKGGKLAGELAGTLGAGGAVAQVAGRSGVAAPALLEAIKTSGMSAGGAGMLTRTAGGAISGAASAGLVNPDDALTGAMIGGSLPGATKLAGMAGQKIGSTLRGPEQTADLARAIQDARSAGYVIPPTQARPTLGNRLIEGMAGKLTTAQNASAANQSVTNRLAARSVGLADDVPLSADALEGVRKQAGQAYKELASLPVVPAKAAKPLMNQPATPEIRPADLVFDLRKARNDATAWYNSYGRTADPDSLVKARAAKSLANSIEAQLETYAKSLGRNDLVEEMAKARQLIAKTHSVEKAMNPASGNIDARQLAKQLAKGKPLSAELKQAAEFAARFPKAAQAVEGMGSLPQTSPLDWGAGALMTAATGPLGLLSVGARPAARSMALSPMVQDRLLQQGVRPGLLSSPEFGLAGYRAAPLLGSDR
jgi:hypothetical protein